MKELPPEVAERPQRGQRMGADFIQERKEKRKRGFEIEWKKK